MARAPGVLALLLALAPGVAAAGMQQRIDALAPGQWLEITESADGRIKDSRIGRVFPKRDGHPAWGAIGPRAVTDAWGGAAYDTKRDLLIVTGGGHTDYGGNEVYAFELRTLAWRRLTEPSRMEEDLSATVDGTPISRHTYDGLEYMPEIDRVVMFGGSFYRNGGATEKYAWLFDPDRGTWRHRAAAPETYWPAAARDPVSGRYYVRLHSGLLEYDPRADRWATLARDVGMSDGTMEFDPGTRRLVFGASGKAWFYALDARVRLPQEIPAAGPGVEAVRHNGLGLAYDPKGRVILGWAGSREVWSLETRSLRWNVVSSADGPAPDKDPDARGIYGKWRYVPSRDVFIGVSAASRNVWLFRAPR